MKRLFILILSIVVSTIVVRGQDTIPTITIDSSSNGKSFSENMDIVIELLDKSQITTGILSDKAYISSLMDEFNGSIESSVITLNRWRQIYRQLYTASIIDTLLPSPDSLKTIAENYIKQNMLPIMIANIKYNDIKTFALDSNLLYYNDGKLYDLQERNQSPYNEKRFFSVVPFNGQIYQGQFNFIFDKTNYFTNTDDTIISIEIDFDDGLGFVNVKKNKSENSLRVNYNTNGIKIITAKVIFSNNDTLFSKSTLNIVPTSSVTPDNSFSVTGYLPYNGHKGTGTAYVLYGCDNGNQLRKPIIVSDGFDPNDERHFYDYLDNNGNIQMGLYSLLNQNNFIEKARAEGFDFVILDYNAGGDYIQRNAQVLISTINNVNSQLSVNGSTSQLTVVGPSMAGLISRYALYFMEQNNLNHNTQLYISFDSPHLGANIPLGDQFWLDFFATEANVQGAIDGRASLLTPAAQQMLVYHYSSYPSTKYLRTNLIYDPYFKFPTKCRKIAIANGSGNNTNYFNPCVKIINYVYTDFGIIDFAIGNAWAVPAPSNGDCTIFRGRLTKVFPSWFTPIFIINQTVKVSNTEPYDSAPGGAFNTNKKIADGDTGGNGDITTSYESHSFIPTVSALALNGVSLNYNVFSTPSYPYINNANVTPFDAIYAATYNQDHVTITNQNIEWIMNEVSPIDLFLQNKIIDNNANFEARNTITIGKNVDPLPNRQQIGDFITNSGSNVNINAGQEIVVKSGTVFKANSNVHLYIDEFSCSSILRTGNVMKEVDSTINELNTRQVDSTIESQLNNENSLNIYPNPNKGQFTIKLNNTVAESILEIYDLMGKKIWSTISSENKLEIDISSQPKGIYLVKVVSENQVIVQKIVYD